MDFILFFCYNKYGDDMKNKGFTMVELLATIVILGVIMLIAVPSVTSVLTKNKKQTFIDDAKIFIALAEATARKNNHLYDCYTLNSSTDIGKCYNISTQDIEKSPYDKKYLEISRVLQCQKGGDYYYMVYLTDGTKSIEGAIKVANKYKTSLGNFNDINEASDKKFDFVVDYNQDYSLECR